jgi:hypothetical protein
VPPGPPHTPHTSRLTPSPELSLLEPLGPGTDSQSKRRSRNRPLLQGHRHHACPRPSIPADAISIGAFASGPSSPGASPPPWYCPAAFTTAGSLARRLSPALASHLCPTGRRRPPPGPPPCLACCRTRPGGAIRSRPRSCCPAPLAALHLRLLLPCQPGTHSLLRTLRTHSLPRACLLTADHNLKACPEPSCRLFRPVMTRMGPQPALTPS